MVTFEDIINKIYFGFIYIGTTDKIRLEKNRSNFNEPLIKDIHGIEIINNDEFTKSYFLYANSYYRVEYHKSNINFEYTREFLTQFEIVSKQSILVTFKIRNANNKNKFEAFNIDLFDNSKPPKYKPETIFYNEDLSNVGINFYSYLVYDSDLLETLKSRINNQYKNEDAIFRKRLNEIEIENISQLKSSYCDFLFIDDKLIIEHTNSERSGFCNLMYFINFKIDSNSKIDIFSKSTFEVKLAGDNYGAYFEYNGYLGELIKNILKENPGKFNKIINIDYWNGPRPHRKIDNYGVKYINTKFKIIGKSYLLTQELVPLVKNIYNVDEHKKHVESEYLRIEKYYFEHPLIGRKYNFLYVQEILENVKCIGIEK